MMKSLARTACLASLLFATTIGWAQITTVTADQAPPIPHAGHDYIKLMQETVSPSVGAVDITIGLGIPSGREMGVPFAIGYDSNAARHSGFMDNAGFLSQGGWRYAVPLLQYSFSVTPVIGTPGNTIVNWCDTVDGYTLTDEEGTLHPLGIRQSPLSWQNCTGIGNWQSPMMQNTDGIVVATTTPMGQSVGPNPRSPAVSVFDHDGMLYSFSNAKTHRPGTYYSFTFDGQTYPITEPNIAQADTVASLPEVIEDRNGNKISFVDDSTPGGNAGTNGAFHIVDTLNRTVASVSSFGNNTPGGPGDTITVSGFAQPYKLTWGTASFNYTIGGTLHQGTLPQFWSCGIGHVVGFGGGTHSGATPVVTALALPNGLSYQFLYDNPNNENPYGLMRKIVYPNGAYVRYVYGLNQQATYEFMQAGNNPPSGEPNTGPPASGQVCEYILDSPAVTKRFVSFDGIHEVLEQDFSYSTTWGFKAPNGPDLSSTPYQVWTQKQTTVTTTDLVTNSVSSAVYTYAPLFDEAGLITQMPAPPSHPGEILVQYKDGTGKILETVTKNSTAEFFLPQDTLKTLDDGQASLHHIDYANNIVTDIYDYDFGTSVPSTIGNHGPLLRHVHADYLHTFPLNPLMPASNTFSSAIIDRPSAVITYDRSGNRVAETDFSYDEGSVASASATQHDDQNFGTAFLSGRGNATTKTAKCFVGSQSCVQGDSITHYTYDITGQQVSRTDPNGNLTTYSYTDSFFDSAPPANAQSPSGITNAYLTQINGPTTNGTHHTQTFAYAFSDGSLTKATDENGNLTKYTYEDTLRRLAETDLPDGGQTKLTYSDSGAAPSVTTTKSIDASNMFVSTAVQDGIGHTIQTQLNSDPDGVDFADTIFDGFGRPFEVNNPHRTGVLPTDGTTKSEYDALGRVNK